MDKKGGVILYAIMVALILIVLALALAPATVEFTSITMNSSNMDCNNESISNFDKAGCIAVDITPFYFIATLIFLAISFIGARIVFGGAE